MRAEGTARGRSIAALIACMIAGGYCSAGVPAAGGPADDSVVSLRAAGASLAASTVHDRSDARPPSGNPLWAISLPTLSFTRERPLFSPSRRPPQPKAVPATPEPQPPPKPEPAAAPPLSLVGTVRGKVTLAIFLDHASNAIVRLRAGEAHAGWVVRTIRDREVLLEKEGRHVAFSLPDASAAIRTATSGSPTRLAAASAGASEPGAPPGPAPHADATPPVTLSATWADGDGRLISPPPPPRMTADGKPPGPPIWLDGYGRPIGPAPTTWRDGDGQSIAPPPYRWLDKDGAAVVPPPLVWRDGDGQLISPPLK